MKLKFLGAAGCVTGSRTLLEHKNFKILVDCGLFQGLKELRLRNWGPLPIDPAAIDAVVLTHAHVDHSGYIPRLVKDGFKGPIYCTPATRDLSAILLPDSGFLMEEEARYANTKGYSKHHPALPLFTIKEAQASLSQFVPIVYGKPFDFGNRLKFTFTNAGHILGASITSFFDGHKTIVFSGDLGRQNDPIMYKPETPARCEVLVLESTYGDRLHPKTDPKNDLASIIKRTVDRKGTVLIPAFAVGRTQSVLFALSELRKSGKIPNIPIYLDSPMAINATDLYIKHGAIHKLKEKECLEFCSLATYVNSVEESKRLDQPGTPRIIISASGMATGGRVLHHLHALGPDDRNTILFTGFQAAGTRGEALVRGKQTIKMHGEEIPIKAEVVNLTHFSAHADQGEIVEWLSSFRSQPQKVLLNHGEPPAIEGLSQCIRDHFRWNVTIPKYLDEIEI